MALEPFAGLCGWAGPVAQAMALMRGRPESEVTALCLTGAPLREYDVQRVMAAVDKLAAAKAGDTK